MKGVIGRHERLKSVGMIGRHERLESAGMILKMRTER